MEHIGIEESRLRHYPICEDADVHRVLRCERVWGTASGRNANVDCPLGSLCAYPPKGTLDISRYRLGYSGTYGEAATDAYRKGVIIKVVLNGERQSKRLAIIVYYDMSKRQA